MVNELNFNQWIHLRMLIIAFIVNNFNSIIYTINCLDYFIIIH
jgi:hypothetical protein